MTEKETAVIVNNENDYVQIEKSILTPREIQAGFKIIGPYVDEETTPVPEFCFVRYGYIIEGEKGMSTHHNNIAVQLKMLIQKHLASKGLQKVQNRVFYSNRVNLSESPAPKKRSEVLPDIAVYDEPFVGDMGTIPHGKVPVLAIEVLSESTKDIDLEEKILKYFGARVKHYWVLAKAFNPEEGLKNSYFYELVGGQYKDVSKKVRKAGKLKCRDIYDLEIEASEIWFEEDSHDAAVRWYREEVRAEEEKRRAEEEKRRADLERQLRIEYEAKWKRYAQLLKNAQKLNENEKAEMKKLEKELNFK